MVLLGTAGAAIAFAFGAGTVLKICSPGKYTGSIGLEGAAIKGGKLTIAFATALAKSAAVISAKVAPEPALPLKPSPSRAEGGAA